MRTWESLAAGTVAVLALSGCGFLAEQAAEEVVERAGGADDVDIDPESGEINIESSEGTFNIGGSDLPDAFPESMPLADGGRIVSSMSTSGEDGQNVAVTVQYPEGGYDALVDELKRALEDNGWSIVEESTSEFGGELKNTTLRVEGHGWTGAVSVQQLGPDQEAVLAVQYTLEASAE